MPSDDSDDSDDSDSDSDDDDDDDEDDDDEVLSDCRRSPPVGRNPTPGGPLAPGGHTAFRSRSNSNMLTHPARPGGPAAPPPAAAAAELPAMP